jgi:hypothetical protein
VILSRSAVLVKLSSSANVTAAICSLISGRDKWPIPYNAFGKAQWVSAVGVLKSGARISQ